MSNVWTQVDSILSTKTESYDEDYHPWVVNTALSHHADTVLLANAMNQNHHLPKRSQYDFLMGAVRKAKRPRQQWHKVKKDEDVELVSRLYCVSEKRAREYLRVLSAGDVTMLRDSVDEGGRS